MIRPIHEWEVKMDSNLAPDFELKDTRGQTIRLSDYRGKKNVVLVFLRGFM
jgi:peroxiredoxin